MSMNLGCSCFKLVQTPTHITNMILSHNQDGEIDGGMEGAARRYILWCKYNEQGELNDACHDPTEQEFIRTHWSTHLADFQLAMQRATSNGEEISFWAQ